MEDYLKNIIDEIINEATYKIANTFRLCDVESIKSYYLGKNGKITNLIKQLKNLNTNERILFGKNINQAKKTLLEIIEERIDYLNKIEIVNNINKKTIDITLPSRGQNLGSIHPITKMIQMFEDFFSKMGFISINGLEIEEEFYNFTALNISKHHPARTMHDTFYFRNGSMLRSQTSTVQVRFMQKVKPPIRMISAGKVFRRDNDVTHSPMFHQLEVLLVEENLNFANLKWLISKFIKEFFGHKINYRFRPSYFPFTEPSAEIDIEWNINENICRWLEIGGCGMVHPNVFRAANINDSKYRGLAFGFGIERLAMLYYGINDIRVFFEGDIQFLEQF